MLWIWLYRALIFVVWVLLPPPKGSPPSRYSLKDACPACGNRGCTYKFERVEDPQWKGGKPMVGRTCGVCGFVHYLEMLDVPERPGK